jgi:hypothetical protein
MVVLLLFVLLVLLLCGHGIAHRAAVGKGHGAGGVDKNHGFVAEAV